MDFLTEKRAKRYFLFLAGLAVALLALGLGLSLLCGRQTQSLLLTQEQGLASALLAQGVPAQSIAAALRDPQPTPQGAALLQKLGHTDATSLWLFPALARQAWRFGVWAVGLCALLAAALLGGGGLFLQSREQLYRAAERSLRRLSGGDASCRLPTGENGALFSLFAAAEELTTALQARSEKEREMREFLKNTISDISHQLKTPLAALTLYNEIVLDEPEDAAAVRHFSQKALQTLTHMETLIQTLLKVTRLDAGSIEFDKKPHPVGRLVAQASESLTTRAAQEGKRLLICGDEAETLCCDLDWTSEAVGNLIKNALDHTGPGGEIRIEWQRSPALLRLSVSDNGEGIAPEDLHHIFKRFYRSRRASGRQGAGLGLPLARAIVEGQGGSLAVHSVYGQGTTFTLSFLTGS